MARPKLKNKEVYQPSGELHRIIPCKAGWAYVLDGQGKLRHVKRNSQEFIDYCKTLSELLPGQIERELTALGWEEELERYLNAE